MRLITSYLVLSLLMGCVSKSDDSDVSPPFAQSHPYMVLTDDVRERIDQARTYEAGRLLFESIIASADEAFEEPEGDEWDANLYGKYAFIAETNAFLIWYTQDCARSERVVEAIERLATDWDNHSGWGINIRMPAPLMHFASAWDFMQSA